MNTIVAKFGGTSLANGRQVRKVIDIIRSNPDRTCIVVSAPGKRHPDDQKVTDLLLELHRQITLTLDYQQVQSWITERFGSIISGLQIRFPIADEMAHIVEDIKAGASADYTASRGEYIMAKILALALGYEFVDAKDCILFMGATNSPNKNPAYDVFVDKLGGKKTVVPGFYGQDLRGNICTFSRGGSDITGALLARGLGASLYENWTDVSGLLAADPRIVDKPQRILGTTYRELRELAYSGASVFHPDAMFPVQGGNIRTRILNTNHPESDGTDIYPDLNDTHQAESSTVVGIASRTGFSAVSISMVMMNGQIGFVRRALQAFEDNGVSVEHIPSGIDNITIVVNTKAYRDAEERIRAGIEYLCKPDEYKVKDNIALIATVGRGMRNNSGTAARLFGALGKAGVNVRMIDQGASEMNILVGVAEADHHAAVRAIYSEFFPETA